MNQPILSTSRLRTSLRVLLAGTTILFSARAHAADDSKQFLSESMQDGIAEIQACNMALKKSQNADVKKFAQRMIADHSRMDQQITALAKRKGVTLATGPTVKKRAINDALAVTWGGVFDREFMAHNVSDHEADVKDFGKQVKEGSDPDVRKFAAEGLQTLKVHLALSKSVAAKVKASGDKKS